MVYKQMIMKLDVMESIGTLIIILVFETEKWCADIRERAK